jgi:hypothetical protein
MVDVYGVYKGYESSPEDVWFVHCARLVDFDNDGVYEFIISWIQHASWGAGVPSYEVRVYQYAAGTANEIHRTDWYEGGSAYGPHPHIVITEDGRVIYFEISFHTFWTEEIYYTIVNGVWARVLSVRSDIIDAYGEETFQVNETYVSESEHENAPVTELGISHVTWGRNTWMMREEGSLIPIEIDVLTYGDAVFNIQEILDEHG